MNIDKVSGVQPILGNIGTNDTSTDNKVSFADFLKDAVNQVNDMQISAQKSNDLLAAGQVDNLHQVMIESEKADIALQYTIQVRNKIMDAYSEIMRMQV